MIFYYSTDNNEPTGGTMVNYRHVDILNAAGIDAAILHHEPGFRIDWFDNTTRIEYLEQARADEGDIVVVAGPLEKELPEIFPGLRKVIFNQGAYLTFFQYPLGYNGEYHYKDALATITVSEDSAEYLRFVFPLCPIFRVYHGIDPDLFYYDPASKKDQIAFMVRKNYEHAKQVIAMFRERGNTCPIVPIQDMHRGETARILRESRIFMAYGYPEGFGLPPAEAMACGCMVIGYDGRGGREYFREPYAIPIEYSDIVSYVKTLEAVVRGDIATDTEGASQFIHEAYSLDRERDSVLETWRKILGM